MKYHIWTVGCQMNVADSRKLAAGLDRAGCASVDAIEDADLVVLNTCSVREHAEDRAIGQLGRLKKMKSRGNPMKVAVMGCMVGVRDDDLRRRFPYVDAFARPQDFSPIMQIAGIDDSGGEFWPTTFAEPDSVTAFVPVIHGCDKFCTYCIVPYRRGREKSRTIADIRNEVEHYCARGVREITLLGQTIEAYGHDLEAGGEPRSDGSFLPIDSLQHPASSIQLPIAPDLGDLMRAIHDVPGLERIRFLTSYPKDMTPRIIDAVAELPKVCENFNIPVQAGDDAVLDRMRRGYTLAEYLEKFEMVRARIPHAAMVTDIMVGFCGETEAEFRNTYDLLERLRFDKVHVAAYSPRPGTIAHKKMEDDVRQEVKQERLHAIEQLEARVSAEINAALLTACKRYLSKAAEKTAGAAETAWASWYTSVAKRRLAAWFRSASIARQRGHCKEQRSPRRSLRPMFGLPEVFVLPTLAFIGMFALVGLVWNMAEGLFEEQRKDQR